MLRIDETSKTLAPQEGGFTPEPPPARDELLTLIASGWQAFAPEIDQKNVAYVAHTMDPGVDMLAFDRSGGRVVVVLVGENGRELLGRALLAGAVVAGWGAEELAGMGKELAAAAPGESPRLILIAPEWDDPTITAVEWLDRKHNLEIKAHRVGMVRFGAERLLTVDDAVAGGAAAAAPDPSADFFAHMQQPAADVPPAAPDAAAEAASTPPPVSA
jgi:hypothetical protein